jgi:transcriptional regulator with XRE-family HTH domain
MKTLQDRAKTRLLEEMKAKHITQRDLAGMLSWSQSKVQKILTGPVELTVDVLEAITFAIGVAATEIVRDPHLEFVMELTPSEMAFLKRVRDLTPPQRDALFNFMGLRAPTRRAIEHDPRRRK